MTGTAITAERVFELYASLPIDPSLGVSKPGCVEGAIGSAVNSAMYAEGVDEEPNLLHVAAYTFFYLARNHCYGDGNKRIAWLTLVDVLATGGLGLAADNDEAYEFVQSVATGETASHDAVVEWVASHLVGAV